MEKKLTIGIPTYNRKNSLEKQITFFLREGILENVDIEFIISDNASEDGTVNFLQEIHQQYPNIRVLYNEKNHGAEANFSKIIQNALGEYVWLVGDDDDLITGVLNEIISSLHIYNDLSWIFVRFDRKIKENYIEKVDFICKQFYRKGIDLFNEVISSKYKLGGVMFVTASVLKTEYALEAIKTYMSSREVEMNNRALTLGLSYYCSLKGSAIATDRSYIIDNMIDIEWKKQSKKVFCRDQIAILDLMSNSLGLTLLNEIDLDKGLVIRNPEWFYITGGFKEDNYAMKFYLRNRPMKIIIDLFSAVWMKIRKALRRN